MNYTSVVQEDILCDIPNIFKHGSFFLIGHHVKFMNTVADLLTQQLSCLVTLLSIQQSSWTPTLLSG